MLTFFVLPVLNLTPSLPVHAIEQSKAVGSDQKIEEVLESVAKQVQQKQQQRESCQDKAVQGGGKSDKPTIDLSRRDLAHSFTMATRATPTTVGSGADPKKCECVCLCVIDFLQIYGGTKICVYEQFRFVFLHILRMP